MENLVKIHVDDFITDYGNKESYARFFFFLHRTEAALKADFSTWIQNYKLFCSYKGKRYRVKGASRMGDIWLVKDFESEQSYDLRVDLADCSNWSKNP